MEREGRKSKQIVSKFLSNCQIVILRVSVGLLTYHHLDMLNFREIRWILLV